jgi:hypothetical protein
MPEICGPNKTGTGKWNMHLIRSHVQALSRRVREGIRSLLQFCNWSALTFFFPSESVLFRGSGSESVCRGTGKALGALGIHIHTHHFVYFAHLIHGKWIPISKSQHTALKKIGRGLQKGHNPRKKKYLWSSKGKYILLGQNDGRA